MEYMEEQMDRLIESGIQDRDELFADRERLDWVEKAILSGVLTSCFELDGGIHVTLDRPGDLTVAERERPNFRDAIDRFRTNCPEP